MWRRACEAVDPLTRCAGTSDRFAATSSLWRPTVQGRLEPASQSDSSPDSRRWRFAARKPPLVGESFRPEPDVRRSQPKARKRSVTEASWVTHRRRPPLHRHQRAPQRLHGAVVLRSRCCTPPERRPSARRVTDECRRMRASQVAHLAPDDIGSVRMGPRPAGRARARGAAGTDSHVNPTAGPVRRKCAASARRPLVAGRSRRRRARRHGRGSARSPQPALDGR